MNCSIVHCNIYGNNEERNQMDKVQPFLELKSEFLTAQATYFIW